MTRRGLVGRGLVHYWRTNLAVIAGVATAVSVLSGALLVGDSVRGTLRDLAFERLGATDLVLSSTGFFREALAADLGANAGVATAAPRLAPLIVARAVVSVQGADGRAADVAVYGVDSRFWTFHGLDNDVRGPFERDAFISPALAREATLEVGGIALVRLARPSDIPLESLHGNKAQVGRTLRVTVRRILPPAALGEFSLEMRQGHVRAVFVPLDRLQAELEVGARVNAILVSGTQGEDRVATIERAVRAHVTLGDVGLGVRGLEARRAVMIDSAAGVLAPIDARAAMTAFEESGLVAKPVFTYLANTIRVGTKTVPYSLVTAIDLSEIAPRLPQSAAKATPPIALNDWAASDLGARIGDPVTLEYYVWEEPGRLVTRSAEFHLAAVVPVREADQDFAPAYPGITDSPTVDSWDPPFPLHLGRVRPKDEQYWERYRTTPKAYIPFEVGQHLWRARFGAMTSVHAVVPPNRPFDQMVKESAERVRGHLDPFAAGMIVGDVRAQAAQSARGATDFGEYFLYFSLFIVMSALLLAALFFRLGVEQRAREVGLLRAVGMDAAGTRRLFLAESLVLAIAGSVLGVAGAVAYAWAVIAGLRTWWIGAVGTTSLVVHIEPLSLVAGGLGGLAAAVGSTWWTLRRLSRISERSLLAGDVTIADERGARRGGALAAGACAVAVGVGLVGAASVGAAPGPVAFFGAGAALLVAALCGYAYVYQSRSRRTRPGRGLLALVRLGARNASVRPGRSVLSIAVVASATFILISVDAFRRDRPDRNDPHSGLGGYALIVETLLPIVHDVSTSDGRAALGLPGLEGASVQPFRLRPGDDASCLNLYRPQNPRILGARADFLAAGRFAFQTTVASTDAERANPWRLLERREADGAVPVIADANSMTYVLHKAVGEDLVIQHGGREVRLRLVAALRDTIFQSELVMAESRFLEVFPDREGYQMLLIESDPEQAAALAGTVGDVLADFGAEVTSTSARLAAFHQVENTYLSTFQTLGALGLLLGTVGLAAVLLRNALERRRELALLGALGYCRNHVVVLLTAESASLLAAGLVAGGVSAGLAIWPALVARGGTLPVSGNAIVLLGVVFGGGVLATVIAARLATKSPVLAALRSD